MSYQRILLKLSGELFGSKEHSIDKDKIAPYAREIYDIVSLSDGSGNTCQVGIVLGGGNIIRGRDVDFLPRETADRLGMLGTVMNAIAFQYILQEAIMESHKNTVTERVLKNLPKAIIFGAFPHREVVKEYSLDEAMRALHNLPHIVIFTGGTGNPFFSTDSAAALRGIQIGADCLLKGTKVDGVYDKDPMKYSDAKLFKKISFQEVLERRLQVMDLTALTLCMENNLPIIVFDITKRGNLKRVIQGENIGTIVSMEG